MGALLIFALFPSIPSSLFLSLLHLSSSFFLYQLTTGPYYTLQVFLELRLVFESLLILSFPSPPSRLWFSSISNRVGLTEFFEHRNVSSLYLQSPEWVSLILICSLSSPSSSSTCNELEGIPGLTLVLRLPSSSPLLSTTHTSKVASSSTLASKSSSSITRRRSLTPTLGTSTSSISVS